LLVRVRSVDSPAGGAWSAPAPNALLSASGMTLSPAGWAGVGLGTRCGAPGCGKYADRLRACSPCWGVGSNARAGFSDGEGGM
jgi:hypothetical protein